jgi:O-antigen ligase
MLGTVLARGYRSGFTLTSIIVTLLAALNWTTFTSADRAAGGVGSQNELWDRLNVIATAIWASHEKPWLGWGVGRFAAVNTYHHQQWSNDVPWRRGWGITSHVNELGILVELGLLGLVLWLSVLVPIVVLLSRAYRDLPVSGLTGQRLAFIGITALTAQLVAGSSVDLRLLEFPTAVVLLLAGLAVGERDRRADPA